jgi:hypothetical protein
MKKEPKKKVEKTEDKKVIEIHIYVHQEPQVQNIQAPKIPTPNFTIPSTPFYYQITQC